MIRQPQTATLCSAQTLTGSAVVQDEDAVSIEGFGLITLTGTVNNATDGALVYLYISDSATAPTTNSGLAQLADPTKVDGTLLELTFPVNDKVAHTIRVCGKWLIAYVKRSGSSSTTTLTLALKAHATST